MAASFQEAVADVLTRKALAACHAHGVSNLIIGGGVVANLAAGTPWRRSGVKLPGSR